MVQAAECDLAATLLERQIKDALIGLLGLEDSAIDDALARLAGDAFVGINQVSSITNLSPPTIYRRIKDAADPFPRPIRVDGRSLWLLTEIRRWISDRVAEHRFNVNPSSGHPSATKRPSAGTHR
jgi:predicted DNA-binding transcriptional regulator AlpA